VEIEGLRKTYPGFTLRDVSWRIPTGYITGLIGPNGAGKTTLIKLIMNLIRKEAGRIRVFGLDHVREERRIKSRVGFVYDTPLPYTLLTLRDYKAVTASFYRGWREETFRRLAAEFALPLRRRIKALSRGMRMKFAIALALSHDADLIIMDEPTSGLDPVFRRELLGKLSELLLDERKTILFSTHVTADLERIADFVALIRNGQVLFSEPKDELLERWAIVKGDGDLLSARTAGLFAGLRRGRFGFEGLTEDADRARKLLPGAVIEKPSLEDIMYHLVESENHD
jgi:ABC-2 type transport system ATP-binding protein